MGSGGKELLMKAAVRKSVESHSFLFCFVLFFFYQDTLEALTEQVRTDGEKYFTY